MSPLAAVNGTEVMRVDVVPTLGEDGGSINGEPVQEP